MAKTRKTASRSAKSGRFVTKEYAKKHPSTTVEERRGLQESRIGLPGVTKGPIETKGRR